MNQLATELQLHYKAVQHHIRILVSSSLLVASGEKYGAVYMLTPWFEAHIETFDQVCAKLGMEGKVQPPGPPGEGVTPGQ